MLRYCRQWESSPGPHRALSRRLGSASAHARMIDNISFVCTKVKEAKTTEVQINVARENYRPAAERASLLYFILSDLNKINPIYQFSLKVDVEQGGSWFVRAGQGLGGLGVSALTPLNKAPSSPGTELPPASSSGVQHGLRESHSAHGPRRRHQAKGDQPDG